MNPTPTSSMQRPTCSGLRLMFAPSASSTSALPDWDETARFPCLATRPPAAAHTNMDAVEMLKVCAPSPPDPCSCAPDRKSTRLNSSHGYISYAVFCLKKKINDVQAVHLT